MTEGADFVEKLQAAADTVAPEDACAHLAQLPAGSCVRLRVSDTGSGMTPEVLARVTEPFFTTKKQGEGTGLGLAMARGFIEQSGGALHIESTPDVGTVIFLWFPVADAAIGAAPATAARIFHTEARLLVVDDEALVRETIAEGLREQGVDVLMADF